MEIILTLLTYMWMFLSLISVILGICGVIMSIVINKIPDSIISAIGGIILMIAGISNIMTFYFYN